MVPKTCFYCISLKIGAWIMAFLNFIFAIIAIIGGAGALYFKHSDEDSLYLIMCIIMGVFNFLTGLILLAAIIVGKENYVLLYILLEMTNLMIISLFAAFNMFAYKSLLISVLFIISILLWYGLYCMYGFYVELAEYNSVKSGVIEISNNTHINPLMILPEKAIESTAV